MSSPKRLFEKTASKRPRRDSDEKQEHSPRENVGRNISTPRAKKPAFNPALLSSAFYSGPTMYGGAGASNSSPYNQYAKSKFYDRKKTDIKVTPSAPDNSMSQTSRRILDFLEQYSSPISDAKRVPINKPPLAHSAKKPIVHQSFLDCTVRSSPDDSCTPSGSRPNRFRELQIPSMATLMKMKRNNCSMSNPQTSITASLSSSLTYKPVTYSLKTDADSGSHKNKIRTKINRRTDRFSDEELPEPVNLPNISLNMTGVKLPTFTMRPFNVTDADTKQYTSSKIPDSAPVIGSTGGFKYGHSGTQPFQATRKFFFRDPLDILSSKYGVPPGREVEDVKTNNDIYNPINFTSISKSKKVCEDIEREEPSLKHLSNRSAQTWNGNDKTVKEPDRSPVLVNGDVRKDTLNNIDPTPKGKSHFNNNDDELKSINPKTDKIESPTCVTDLADFIKKQKSQSWECSMCMLRNDNDKLKCVCCETPKSVASEVKSPDTAKNTPVTSGLVDFIKKQSSQWECASCITRNDNDKLKCVCCETAKPGAAIAPAGVAAGFVYPGMANFMKKQSAQWECSSCMTRNNDDRVKCVCCEATKPGCEPEKPAANFNFGSPQTANSFKFGIDQADSGKSPVADAKPSVEDKKTIAPATGFVFGNTAEVKTDNTKVGGFTFGITNGNPAVSKESTAPNPVSIFGEKKEATAASVVPTSNTPTFGIKKPEIESNKAIVSSSTSDVKTSTFTFSSPKTTSSTLPALNNESEKVQGGFVSSLAGLSSTTGTKLSSPALSTTSASDAPKPAAPTFTFGSSQTTKPGSGFGASTPFQFGAVSTPASTIPAFKPPAVPLTFSFGGKDSTSNASTIVKPSEPTVSGAEALFRIPPANPGSLFAVPTSSSPANQNSLKDKVTGNIASSLQFPSAVQAVPEKPKENSVTPSPFFGFGTPASDTSAASSGAFKTAVAAAPVFTFGANAAAKSEAAFGSSSTAPSVNLFGAKSTVESEPSNSPSTGMFKSSAAPSPFGSSTNLFGSPALTSAQPPVHTVFGANPLGQTASKPASGIFGASAAPQPASLFPGASAAPPTFSSGNIFGARPNPVAQSSTGPFGSQTLNKTEAGGAFMNNANPAPSGNLFGVSPSPVAPSVSSGGLFGSGNSAPTPVFGAAIPFGEAPRPQPSQGVGFTFGASDSSMGFGRPAGPPPVYSFGSQSAAPPSTGSQFNFTMGASASGFNPGVNPNGPQRKMKKAVRRTMR